MTNERQTKDKRVTTTNKDNKGNKDNKDINSIEVAKATTLKEYIKNTFDESFLLEIYNKYNISKIDFQDECEAFVLYWQEKSPRWKKQRWEKEKTFDPKLRFRTWMRNNKKWNNNTSKPKWIWALD